MLACELLKDPDLVNQVAANICDKMKYEIEINKYEEKIIQLQVELDYAKCNII